jgi:hypothetical protein
MEKKTFEIGIWIIFLVSLTASLLGIISFAAFVIGKYSWTERFLLYVPVRASVVPFHRISSTLVLPEMFITFSQLGMVAGMILLEIERSVKWKITLSLGVIIIILAACIAYSRSLAGFFVALSIILFFKKSTRYLVPLKIGVSIVTTLLLLLAIMTSIWIIYPVKVSKDQSEELLTVSIHTSPDIRFFLRNAAIEIALKYPLFGIGQGVFTSEVKDYIDISAARNTFKINNFNNKLEADPHCAYLGTLAETGFLGFSAMGIFLYSIIYVSARYIKNMCPSTDRSMCIYLLAGLVGYLVTGLFVDIFSMRQFWLNSALLISAFTVAKQNNGY